MVATFADHISGAKGRDKRPGLDDLIKAATQRQFDLVAAWSVDRLGRSLQHLVQCSPSSRPSASTSTYCARRVSLVAIVAKWT